jgi:hypothetical protein
VDGAQDIWNTVTESWDATSRTKDAGSGTVDVEVAPVHDSGMGF